MSKEPFFEFKKPSKWEKFKEKASQIYRVLRFPWASLPIKVIFRSSLCERFGVDGIVLYPYVHIKGEYLETKDSTLLAHEMVHVLQIKSNGAFYFYLSYTLEYLFNRLKGQSKLDAYLNISYEKQARNMAKNDTGSLINYFNINTEGGFKNVIK